MRVNLKLARVGMNMQEATIVKWHRRTGESFKAGDALYDIETEKVTQEVTAPGDGRLLDIMVPEGGNARVNEPVCCVDLEMSGTAA